MKDLNDLSNLEKEINKYDGSSAERIRHYNKIIIYCQEYLNYLFKEIRNTGFDSKQTEIEFFKKKKQIPFHKLIYYNELKLFEIKFPKAGFQKKKKFIIHLIKKQNKFFENNSEFVQYIQLGLTHFDEFYFTRKYHNKFASLFSIPFYRDPEFSSSHDFLLAKLNANLKLVHHFENKLMKLQNPAFQEIPKSQLKWTSSKVALTELTYALYHGGAVNNGNTDIREIATALEHAFNFPIGDVYRTYSEIRSRKNRRSKFLDELSSSLLTGMDTLDK